MKKRFVALAAAVFALGLIPAKAADVTLVLPDQQTPFGTPSSPLTVQCSFNGVITSCGGGSGGTTQPATGTGAYNNPATVTATSTQVLAAAPNGRVFLDLKNESPNGQQPIACAFGGTAALNTAGSFTIAAGGDARWEGSFVPSDQINCITSAGNTAPLTIGAH